MFVLHSKPLFMFVKHLSSHSVFFKIIYLSITIRSISWNESISPASSAYDAFSDTTRHRSAIDHYFSRHGAEDPEGPHGEVVRWGEVVTPTGRHHPRHTNPAHTTCRLQQTTLRVPALPSPGTPRDGERGDRSTHRL